MLGDGYCFGSVDLEKPHRIGSWTEGNISAAKAACEANPDCVGVHYDARTPNFILLAKVGVPGGQDPGNRLCYKYPRPGRCPCSHIQAIRWVHFLDGAALSQQPK